MSSVRRSGGGSRVVPSASVARGGVATDARVAHGGIGVATDARVAHVIVVPIRER